MKAKEKVSQLSSIIKDKLAPIVNNDYLLLDVPYYTNVGDTLIWQGTMDFLSDLPYRCLGMTNATGNIDFKITKDTVILLQGGGNFGDLWVLHQNFRKRIITQYPNNPIIILPQSIFFENRQRQEEDAAFFAGHPNVTICVRDRRSLEVLKKYYPNNSHLLLPDMAFCINAKSYGRGDKDERDSLFVKRNDKELSNEDSFSIVPPDAFVSDWLNCGNIRLYRIKDKLERYAHKIDKLCKTHIQCEVADYFWQNVLRQAQVQYAINFLLPYKHIYTTRMHAAILSVILEKENITLFDNSYGKLSSFTDAWLNDVDGLKIIGSKSKD